MARTKEEIVELIASRVAKDFKDGDFVNLGIGMPTKAVAYIPENVHIILQSENGMIGMGKAPSAEKIDKRIFNAGGQDVTCNEGGMFFDSAYSFGLIRGGHVDITVLGGLEVDQHANLANWAVPGKFMPGMGGAMDLVNGVKEVIVVMEHCDKNGVSKVKKNCSLPLTGKGVVNRLITELAVFDFEDGKMKLIEIQPGSNLEEIKEKTEADFEICLAN